MTSAKAFLLLFIDTANGNIARAGVYGAPVVTADLRLLQVVAMQGHGIDYEAGLQHLRDQIRSAPDRHRWLNRYLGPDDLWTLGLL